MSNGRSELLIYLGAAFSTAIGLFVLRGLYAGYVDMQYHQRLAQGGPYESVLAAREEDQKLLAQGKLPLDQAMQLLTARGRGSFASIAPQPSEDLSPISGWIRHPSFKPVVAHPIRTPRAPQVVEVAPPPEEAPPASRAPLAPAPQPPKRRPAR